MILSDETTGRRQHMNKQFWTFVSKEFIHILRDPLTLLILIGMPIVEMIIFGFALNMDVSHIRTIIVGGQQDQLSRRITEAIRANPYFILEETVPTTESVKDKMIQGNAEIAIILPPRMEEDIMAQQKPQIQILTDASDPNSADIRIQYASAIIGENVRALLGADAARQLPYSIDINTRMLYNPSLKSSYNFVPGIMGLVLIIICTIMTSVSIAREKEKGSMELLLASPASSTAMVLAKTVPYFCVSVINMISILLLSYFALGVPIRGSLLLIALGTMVYILLSLAIGLVISGLVAKQSSAIMISGFAMMMPTMMFSGMLFPVADMPVLLQPFSYIVPATYYISMMRKVMIQGLPLSGVWHELVILIAFAISLLVLAIRNVKPRLK